MSLNLIIEGKEENFHPPIWNIKNDAAFIRKSSSGEIPSSPSDIVVLNILTWKILNNMCPKKASEKWKALKISI